MRTTNERWQRQTHLDTNDERLQHKVRGRSTEASAGAEQEMEKTASAANTKASAAGTQNGGDGEPQPEREHTDSLRMRTTTRQTEDSTDKGTDGEARAIRDARSDRRGRRDEGR